MGSLFGGGSAKKAALEQAKATRDAAAAQATQAKLQTESMANQISLSQQQRVEQARANDLLSTPMESAVVDLATSEDPLLEEDSRLRRRRSTRDTYQSERSFGIGEV